MSEQENKNRQVKCPQCGRLTLYSTENVFRPFCSERCRKMDLGAWASETYKIPSAPSTDSLEGGEGHEENDSGEGS